MHELGLADAILKTVERVAKEENAPVCGVTVEVGDLSGVVPRFLTDAWKAVCDGTPYAGVPFHLHTVPATARCEECGKIFVVDVEDLRCPGCGSEVLTPLSGRDLTIAEIEVYDPEAEEETP